MNEHSSPDRSVLIRLLAAVVALAAGVAAAVIAIAVIHGIFG
jgi:hypothetical protein